MSTFHGGPADGVTLMLARAPLYLRVVTDQFAGKTDALDQLDDQADEHETIHVYRRRGDTRMAHINYGRQRSRSGFYSFADYDHVDTEPETAEQLRDNLAWQAWVGDQT
jgi:hypothetical protein